MDMMNIKTLKKLLEPYDDASHIKILDKDGGWLDIKSVLIEYIEIDDYQVPCIILKTDCDNW